MTCILPLAHTVSQNCFDVLCAELMNPEGKTAFVKAEGVELMWLMLQVGFGIRLVSAWGQGFAWGGWP